MTKQHMPRLPRPRHVRDKISAKLKGRVHSPETRAKMSAALKGRPKSPEARANIAAARRARKRLTPDELAAEMRKRHKAVRDSQTRERFKQWGRDRRQARLLGDPELIKDVRRSWGWHSKRRYLGFPGVSDGYSAQFGHKVMWSPYPYVRLAKVPSRGKSISRRRGRAPGRLPGLRQAGVAADRT